MIMKFLDTFSGIGGFHLALEKSIGKENIECIGFSEIDKFAKIVYKEHFATSPDLWDITKIDIENLPDFDLLTGGFPCFKEWTMVLTQKWYKDIKNMEVWDYVLTHTNKYQKVLRHFVTPNKKWIYNVKIQGALETFVTNEHPYYVREMTKKWNNSIRKYERVFSEPKWKNVEDLNKWDFIWFNIQDDLTECSDKSLKFYKLVWRLLADGWWGSYSRWPNIQRKSHRVVLCCNKNQYKEVEELLEWLFNYSKVDDRTVLKYYIANKEFVEYMEQFWKYSYWKFIPTSIMWLNKEYLEQLLIWYIDWDWHYYKDKWYYRVSSVSKKLILWIQQLVHKVYWTPTSVYYTKRKPKTIIEWREVNQRDTYSLDIKFEKKTQDNWININWYMWLPFKSKEYLEETNTVYNIEVENDNSYTANNCIVHNCQDVSVAWKQNLKEGWRTILVEYLLQILETKQPQYFIFENVKGLLNKKFKWFFESILDRIKDAGYDVKFQVLNTKDFWLPQNRQRVFIVWKLGVGTLDYFNFPEGKELNIFLKDILEKEVDSKFFMTEEQYKKLSFDSLKRIYNKITPRDSKQIKLQVNLKDPSFCNFSQDNIFIGMDWLVPTLTAGDGWNRPKIYEFIKLNNGTKKWYAEAKIGDGVILDNPKSITKRSRIKEWISGTLTVAGVDGVVLDDFIIRKLTPVECARLQGFPDNWSTEFMSNSQAYKQAGNAVSVPVVKAIFDNLLK